MRPRLPSTSTRLALVVMGFFLAAFVLLGTGVYYAVSALLQQEARELVRSDALALADVHRGGGHAALLDELRHRVEVNDDPDAVYALEDANGVALLGRMPRARARGAGGRWVEFNEAAAQPGDAVLRVVAFEQVLPGGDVLLAGQRLRAQDRFLSLMQDAALVALLFAASLGALVGWLTSRWVARRLRSLDDTADRVGAGELGLRVPLDESGDAFDRVAHRFNAMLDRIEALLDGVRHATDHIAHDLRTPLTRLRNRLEALRRRDDAATHRPALDAALAETDQLLQSFGALLRLARIEAQPPLQDQPLLDLRELASDALELYTPVAAERGIRLHPSLQHVQLRGDRDQLFQLVVNLLDNAVKYAPADSTVEFTLESGAANAVMQVADHGAGIPETERERVFDRFQRLEPHRGSPGIGLGLSLVRAIVQRHGGHVALLDNAPGLRARVELPVG